MKPPWKATSNLGQRDKLNKEDNLSGFGVWGENLNINESWRTQNDFFLLEERHVLSQIYMLHSKRK
jgi:hypothetical protein